MAPPSISSERGNASAGNRPSSDCGCTFSVSMTATVVGSTGIDTHTDSVGIFEVALDASTGNASSSRIAVCIGATTTIVRGRARVGWRCAGNQGS